MNKKRIILFCCIIAMIFIVVLVVCGSFGKGRIKLKKTEGITIVPTMNDEITNDSAWCGTFQLVWNDLKNEIIGKDIVLNPQLDIVTNLNKEDFNESMLSEGYYYKNCGLTTKDLKNEIEAGIWRKFHQKSDIIDSIDWDDIYNPDNPEHRPYVLYSMLYREFEYLKKFDVLENGTFGNKYNNVKYFGIDKDTKNSVGAQIQVLYYNSKDDFAIIINTKSNDEVIFCKGKLGNTFKEIYFGMINESNQYKGNRFFDDYDSFKAPNLDFNVDRDYIELCNQEFETSNPGDIAKIKKATQTIQFSLGEKGGRVKSEVALNVAVDSISSISESRHFYVDDTFTLFLREKGKELPYFAARIDDITKYQNN